MKKPAVFIVDDDPSHLRIYGWIIQSAGLESVSATGRNLLQPHHQEFTGNNSNAVGIRRNFFDSVSWTWQMLIARSHRVSRIRSILAITSLSLCLFAAAVEAAAVSQPAQSDVEAVYLLDFGKFVRWPAGADQGPMSICVAGSPSFSTGLERLISNEKISGRTLDVRRVSQADDESGCAILFIDATQRDHAEELLQAVADKPTLTVGDLPQFLSRGGMIQFQVVEKRIRFSVNLDAVNRRHLTMSSELLKIAMSVKGRTPEGGAQ